MHERTSAEHTRHFLWSDLARTTVSLENESSDGCGVRSRGTGTGEVRLRIQISHAIASEEGGVRIVRRRHTWLHANFGRRQPVTHIIEVDRSGTGRRVIFRNTHP